MCIRKTVTTIVLTPEGALLKIRKPTEPAPQHHLIYEVLGIPSDAMPTRKFWLPTQESG